MSKYRDPPPVIKIKYDSLLIDMTQYIRGVMQIAKHANTETITLPDNNFWTIRTIVTRGMRKKFQNAALGIIGTSGRSSNGDLDLADPNVLRKAMLNDPAALNLSSIDDAYLLYGTIAYSFGEIVSLEVIDELDERMVGPVLLRMQVLYAAPTEEESQNFTGIS